MGMLPLLLASALALPEPIAAGDSKLTVDIDGTKLDAYAYKPASYRRGPLIVVFHGTLRNAEEYRDFARGMGDRYGALIVAPHFDRERFPNRRYHRGSIVREDGTAAPKDEWTYRMVPKLVDHLRKLEGRRMPYYLIGHSAGGQFLVRMAAFDQRGAVRIVAANAGSQLFPRTDWPFGYGFGTLPDALQRESVLKAYLAQPLTLYQGTADNGPDEDLDTSAEAMAQGPGRLQRGQAAFAYAQALAKQKGWRFNWRIVEAPGIGHVAKQMFDHEKVGEALGIGKQRW